MTTIRLKDDHFTYCGKGYTQRREVSADLKYLFTHDGLYYVRAYAANADGKGERIYLKKNEDGFPVTSIEQAQEEIIKQGIDTPHKLNIHKSQYHRSHEKKTPIR